MFAVVDLETNGLRPRSDRIVEVAVCQLDAQAVLERSYATLVNPGGEVGRTDIHGIRPEDVRGAPNFAEVAPQLWELLRGRVLVAHPASFDIPFLASELRRCGAMLPTEAVLCTGELARAYMLGGQSRYQRGWRLQDCCRMAGIRIEGAHHALGDATATAKLLHYMGQRYGAQIWSAEVELAGLQRWAPAPPGPSADPWTREQAAAPATRRRPRWLRLGF